MLSRRHLSRRYHRKAKIISEREQSRRAQQREQALAAVQRLLYSRAQTARALGASVRTVQRMEQRGLLDQVRLAGSPNGMVYHRVEQVVALAQGGDHA
jgi:hypothetical protein